MSALEELAAAFLSATLPKEQWTHLAHLRVGAWFVHHQGAEAALRALRNGIRRLNTQHGTLDSATSGYHETITVAYVRLITEFWSNFAAEIPLADRVEVLSRSALAEKSLLLRFWSRQALMSEQARAEWTPPDLAPLALPADALAHARLNRTASPR